MGSWKSVEVHRHRCAFEATRSRQRHAGFADERTVDVRLHASHHG